MTHGSPAKGQTFRINNDHPSGFQSWQKPTETERSLNRAEMGAAEQLALKGSERQTDGLFSSRFCHAERVDEDIMSLQFFGERPKVDQQRKWRGKLKEK
jgi:hypothetical protein